MKTPVFMFVAFFAVFLSVYGGAHFYVYWRLVHDTRMAGPLLRVLQLVFVVLCLLFPLSHWGMRYSQSGLVHAAAYASALWLGIIAYLFMLVLAFDVLKLVLALLNSITHWNVFTLLFHARQNAIVIVVTALLVCGYGLIEARMIHSTRLRLPVPGLSESLDGFRIAQLSDVHLGALMKGKRLDRMVELVNDEKPDLVVITGDLLDGEAHGMQSMVESLRALKSCYGVYAVTGNHEFFAGVDSAAAFMEHAGITLLRNRWVTIAGNIQLAGRDDIAAKRMAAAPPPLQTILQGTDKNKPLIFLYHTPVTTFDDLAANNIHVQLSGHTHKGQLWPFNYIVKRVFKMPYGLFTRGSTSVYVSSGTGTWGPPMRVAARPEIVMIELYPGRK